MLQGFTCTERTHPPIVYQKFDDVTYIHDTQGRKSAHTCTKAARRPDDVMRLHLNMVHDTPA